MAFKYPNAGDLTTKINIEDVIKAPDGQGSYIETWVDIFGGEYAQCRWITQNFTARSTDDQVTDNRVMTVESVLVTMRGSPLITQTCRAFKHGDMIPWYIVGAVIFQENGAWVQFILRRRRESI